MKVQIINKYTKKNIFVGMRVGENSGFQVPAGTLQINWNNAEPTIWNSENNFCAEVSEAQIKAIKEHFRKHYSKFYSLKITDRKEFENENSSNISYKGFNADTLCGYARDYGCTFSQIDEILIAVSEGRLNMQDKEVVKNVKRLMKLIFNMKSIDMGQDSNGKCLYGLSEYNRYEEAK